MKLVQCFWRRIFFIHQCIFIPSMRFCPKYLALEMRVAVTLDEMQPRTPQYALCDVRLKMALWFQRRFLNIINIISLIRNYFPFEKGRDFHLHKLEYISFIQEFMLTSLVEICPVVLVKKIFKFHQCIFTILLWSPLGKGRDRSFEQS